MDGAHGARATAARSTGFVERIADRIGAHAEVKAVFGDPIERDGITVIPVAKVRWGFGGGAGPARSPVGPGRPGDESPFGDDPWDRRDRRIERREHGRVRIGRWRRVTADPIG